MFQLFETPQDRAQHFYAQMKSVFTSHFTRWSPEVLVDLGAGLGALTEPYLSMESLKRVYLVEGNPETAQKLRIIVGDMAERFPLIQYKVLEMDFTRTQDVKDNIDFKVSEKGQVVFVMNPSFSFGTFHSNTCEISGFIYGFTNVSGTKLHRCIRVDAHRIWVGTASSQPCFSGNHASRGQAGVAADA